MSRKNVDISYTQNREMSWLKFNERVLEEAKEVTNPLMERLKFIAIVTSNLDEFFMIRVGSITDLLALKAKKCEDKQNMTPQQELDAIYKASAQLVRERDQCFLSIEEELESYGIVRKHLKELDKSDRKYIDHYAATFIEPVLSPQIIDPHHPFPHLENKALYVAVRLKDKETRKLTYGIIPVPKSLGRVIRLQSNSAHYCIL